jgi:hypothetical protein
MELRESEQQEFEQEERVWAGSGLYLAEWETIYEKIREYKQRYGSGVTVKRKNNDYDSKLERWIGKQKKDILKYGSSPGSTYLDDIRIQRLIDIGVTPTVDRVSQTQSRFRRYIERSSL